MSGFEPSLIATDSAVRDEFIAALTATGSVVAAARATGVARSTATRLRRRDPAFAAAWAVATDHSTAHELETALLSRAIHGVERYRFLGGGGVELWVEYDNATALKLLARLMPGKYGPAAGTVVAAARPVMSRADFFSAIRAQPRLDPPIAGLDDD